MNDQDQSPSAPTDPAISIPTSTFLDNLLTRNKRTIGRTIVVLATVGAMAYLYWVKASTRIITQASYGAGGLFLALFLLEVYRIYATNKKLAAAAVKSAGQTHTGFLPTEVQAAAPHDPREAPTNPAPSAPSAEQSTNSAKPAAAAAAPSPSRKPENTFSTSSSARSLDASSASPAPLSSSASAPAGPAIAPVFDSPLPPPEADPKKDRDSKELKRSTDSEDNQPKTLLELFAKFLQQPDPSYRRHGELSKAELGVQCNWNGYYKLIQHKALKENWATYVSSNLSHCKKDSKEINVQFSKQFRERDWGPRLEAIGITDFLQRAEGARNPTLVFYDYPPDPTGDRAEKLETIRQEMEKNWLAIIDEVIRGQFQVAADTEAAKKVAAEAVAKAAAAKAEAATASRPDAKAAKKSELPTKSLLDLWNEFQQTQPEDRSWLSRLVPAPAQQTNFDSQQQEQQDEGSSSRQSVPKKFISSDYYKMSGDKAEKWSEYVAARKDSCKDFEGIVAELRRRFRWKPEFKEACPQAKINSIFERARSNGRPLNHIVAQGKKNKPDIAKAHKALDAATDTLWLEIMGEILTKQSGELAAYGEGTVGGTLPPTNPSATGSQTKSDGTTASTSPQQTTPATPHSPMALGDKGDDTSDALPAYNPAMSKPTAISRPTFFGKTPQTLFATMGSTSLAGSIGMAICARQNLQSLATRWIMGIGVAGCFLLLLAAATFHAKQKAGTQPKM